MNNEYLRPPAADPFYKRRSETTTANIQSAIFNLSVRRISPSCRRLKLEAGGS
jgi:hypothetical protein